MPASILRAKPGTSSTMPANSRWPSTTSSMSVSATTVALRGAFSSRASSPNASPGPMVAILRPWRHHLGGAAQDHEELVAGLALGDEGLAGRDAHLLRPLGDQLEVLAGAGREQRDLLEVIDEDVMARHGRGI